jgi:hypothetical protein
MGLFSLGLFSFARPSNPQASPLRPWVQQSSQVASARVASKLVGIDEENFFGHRERSGYEAVVAGTFLYFRNRKRVVGSKAWADSPPGRGGKSTELKSPDWPSGLFDFLRVAYCSRRVRAPSCPPQGPSSAPGALPVHRSGLEAALFQPAHDLVLGEADVRFDPHIGDSSALRL